MNAAIREPVMGFGTGPSAGTGTKRLLAAGWLEFGAHLERVGPIPWVTGSDQLIRLMADSGLTGRGGAGFPSARKLAAVAAGRRAVVVANGAEGEPLSSKDRYLLTHAPHLVFDGLQLLADAVGAAQAFAYVPEDSHRRAAGGSDRARWGRSHRCRLGRSA